MRLALAILAVLTFSGGAVMAEADNGILVIAHRGASGERPEHTRAAYELAIAQGADIIEPDVVMSRDGQLIVRHENEIGSTTDIADHPEFAARRTTRTIDGHSVTGWFVEDFTLAELRRLSARERLPNLRPGNTSWRDEPILTLQQVIDIGREASVRTGRRIGVAPEIKHPTYLAGLGLPIIQTVVETLRDNGLDGEDAPAIVQCFEVGALQRLNAMIDTPLMQLIANAAGPFDRPDLQPGRMVDADGLQDIARYADWVGVETTAIVPPHVAGTGRSTSLVNRAHQAGLKVAAWTFRTENGFLPPAHRRDDPSGRGDLSAHVRDFRTAGVDAVFSDFPGLTVEALAP